MSKIDEMIRELCPDGVERVPFLECATLTRGITYNKSQEANRGQESYKVLRANNITLGLNCLNFDDVKEVLRDVKVKPEQWLKKDDILICAGSGSKEHVGKVAYIYKDIDYCFGGFMGVIRPNQGVLNRYLFHCLIGNTFSEYLSSALNSTTINNLNNQVMSGFRIPLPPLSIQQEIVSVLDSFTTLNDKMKQEVEKRKKQMEYYREELLTFEDGECEWKTLGEVAEIGTGCGNTNEGLEEGLYPFYTRGQEILRKNTFEYDEEAIITAGDGVGVGKVMHYVKGKYALHQRAYRFKPNEGLSTKYLYYYMQVTFYKYVCGNAVASSVSSLRKPKLQVYPIPIPSLTKQREIVSTLDKFESYISKLEKMIVLRQKQYEYYREKLLTFE